MSEPVIKTKPTIRGLRRFEYFSECEDTNRLVPIPMDENGYTAAECFHVHETYGKLLPCREPELLTRALNGKEWHGVTVENCAKDYVDRILFACEIRENHPKWVQKEIFAQAAKVALQKLGYVPTFVKTGDDFTTISMCLRCGNSIRYNHQIEKPPRMCQECVKENRKCLSLAS